MKNKTFKCMKIAPHLFIGSTCVEFLGVSSDAGFVTSAILLEEEKYDDNEVRWKIWRTLLVGDQIVELGNNYDDAPPDRHTFLGLESLTEFGTECTYGISEKNGFEFSWDKTDFSALPEYPTEEVLLELPSGIRHDAEAILQKAVLEIKNSSLKQGSKNRCSP